MKRQVTELAYDQVTNGELLGIFKTREDSRDRI